MELRHLRYFVAVAEEENISRAAARLHVSQPPLSRQIRDLEEELGVLLFDRGPRSLRLTEAGRFFLKDARLTLEKAAGSMQAVKDFAHGQESEFHLGYAPSLTTQILPQALRLFQETCPEVKVRLRDLSTEEMLAGLREGALQAALLVRPSTRALEGLVYEEIIRYRLSVALPLTHPLGKLEKVAPGQLAGEPLVAYARSEYPEHHDLLETVFNKVRPAPRVTAEYDSSTSLIAAVESGAGVALVQEGFENLSGARLALRLLDSPSASFSFGIAWRGGDLSDRTRHFVAAGLSGKRAEV